MIPAKFICFFCISIRRHPIYWPEHWITSLHHLLDSTLRTPVLRNHHLSSLTSRVTSPFDPTTPRTMSKSCKGLFDELLRCLSDSQCVIEHPDRKTALRECVQPDAVGVSDSCKAIRVAYSQCRKSQVDMRRRIRGMPGY